METEVRIEADRLAKALRERLEAAKGGAADAVDLGCRSVERAAKTNAPKDTGLLRRSITHRVTQQGEDIMGQVGTNVHYAIHVEYGHRTRKGKNSLGGDIRYVPGVYFLTRALRNNENKVRGAIWEALLKQTE